MNNQQTTSSKQSLKKKPTVRRTKQVARDSVPNTRKGAPIITEEPTAAAAKGLQAMAESNACASALEGSDPAKRSRIFRDHVGKVLAGEGVLTLVLPDGQRIERSIAKLRHGNDARLLLGQTSQDRPAANPQLLKLLFDAHRARALALKKPSVTLDQLSTEFGRSSERFKRLVRLSYLAPAIVESIMSGEQPAELTSIRLENLDGLPVTWAEQQAMLLG